MGMTETPKPPANLPAIPELSPFDLAKLAREVAMDIKELDVVLGYYRLTLEQYAEVCKIPFFKRALENSTLEWNSALSTHERMKIEAAAILEEGLPILGARMKNKDETFAAATEAGKLFAKIAGLGEVSRDAPAPGEKFTITINLGDDTKLHYEKDVTPASPVIEGPKNE